MDLLGFENYADLKDAHYKWVDSAMQTDNSDKENNRKHIFMESTTTILNRAVLHENWSIKTEILVFLGIFYWFFNMLLWPDPRTL